MFLHYLKISLRTLQRYRVQSVLNILALSVGLMAFSLGSYWLYWEHHFDDFHPDSSHTFAITTLGLFKDQKGRQAELNQLHGADAQIFTTLPEVKNCTFVNRGGGLIQHNETEIPVNSLLIDSAFSSIFRMELLAGTLKNAPYNYEYAVLCRSLAERLFGETDCTGKTLVLNPNSRGEQKVKVAAVMENYPGNTELIFDILILGPSGITNNRKRSTCYIQLREEADVTAFSEKITIHKSVSHDPYGVDYSGLWSFRLRSLPEVHLKCNYQLEERFQNIYILYYTGLALLLVALMNNLVLFIAMQQRRQKGLLTYRSIGAKTTSLLTKGLVELLAPVAAAWILSWLWMELLFPFFAEFSALQEWLFVQYVKRTMEYSSLLLHSLVRESILLGMYVVVCTLLIVLLLKQGRKVGKQDAAILSRRILVTGQIAVSSLFLLISLALYTQLYYLHTCDKGIRPEHIIQIDLGSNTCWEVDAKAAKQALLQVPGVKDVTLLCESLLKGDGMFENIGIVRIEGRDREKVKQEQEEDNLLYVEENFFSFFGMRFLEGSELKDDGVHSYVVNETGAHQLGMDHLLERPVGNSSERIAGIIADYHYAPLRFPVRKIFFTIPDKETIQYTPFRYLYVMASPGQEDSILPALRQAMQPFDRGEVKESENYQPLTELLRAFNRPEEILFLIFSLFSLCSILIASSGIYALVALSTEQRRKEIAIRKVNGALYRNILYLFLREYLVLVAVGNLIAFPLAYYALQLWLNTFTYHTSFGFGWFVLVFVLTAGIVFLSVTLQIRKAIRVQPASVLKTE